jgi:uncharacterized protein YecE (DUF72 family)
VAGQLLSREDQGRGDARRYAERLPSGEINNTFYQLPPFLKKDAPRVQDCLQLLPTGHRATFEFRHDSWFDDDNIYALLKSAGASLCGRCRSKCDPVGQISVGVNKRQRQRSGSTTGSVNSRQRSAATPLKAAW